MDTGTGMGTGMGMGMSMGMGMGMWAWTWTHGHAGSARVPRGPEQRGRCVRIKRRNTDVEGHVRVDDQGHRGGT
eukprot:5503906-Prymnesium_polylepis.2